MKMKKIVSMLLLAVMSVCTLASCKKDEIVVDPETGIVVVNNGDRMYKEGVENPDILKISFTEAGLGRDWLVETSKEFIKANPNYEIRLYGDPQLASSLATKLESGKNLSDVIFPLNTTWELYASKGWLEPLDDVYAAKPDGEDGVTNAEKMQDVYREYCNLETSAGTHYYVMPWNTFTTGIAYNVKMFEQYGWEVPTTTDDLEALCKKILADTNGEVKPFAYPGKIGGYFDYIGSTWWMQASGMESYKSFFQFESAEVYNTDSDPARGKKLALEEFARFFANEDYCVKGSMSKDHTLSQMDFVSGAAAMIVNANWLENEMKTNMPEGFTMGLMNFPYLKDAKKDADGNYKEVNYITPPDLIMIPKEASEKEGAKKFLTFMNSDEMLELYTATCGSPRPFDYDLESIEGLSKFTEDALGIVARADSYFDFSRASLWMSGKAQKYIGGQPYGAIIRGETDARRFCNTEYVTADDSWEEWLATS